jgi:zinc protease
MLKRWILVLLVVTVPVVWAGLPVTEYTLKNGMRVLVYEDHSAPVVSTQIWYRVGSYNEPAGQTGISHLLEHMMFKGTKRYGPKEYDRIIDQHGGEENGFTGNHYTVYYANLFKDYYPIELAMEADRMANLRLDSLEFQRERKVVMEERRLSENDPYGLLFETFDEVAYLRHPYRNPTVGWMEDLQQITRRNLVDYYHKWYNPANALVVVAGDIKPAEARESVERSFGKIKGEPAPELVVMEPEQRGERRIEVKREVGSKAILIGYHIPEEGSADSDVLNVITGILFRGRTSRMYKKLVYEDQQALSCSGWVGNSKYPGVFSIFAIPRQGKDLARLEESIYQGLEQLKTGDIEDRELARVKNQTIAGFLFRQDSFFGMGLGLANTEIITGSYRNLETYPERIGRVTKEEIREVAKKYFTKDNRTVAILVPEKEAK